MSETDRSVTTMGAFNSTLDALLTAKGIVTIPLGLPTIGMMFSGVREWLFNDAVWVVPFCLWAAAVLWSIRKDRESKEQKLTRDEKRHEEERRLKEREELREIASFAERLHAQEMFSNRNRWLELESRRDAYARVCRRRTRRTQQSIQVVSRHEPKILVTLRDSHVLDSDSENTEIEYFTLTPSKGIESNRWVADKELGTRIRSLQEKKEARPHLGIVWEHGSRVEYKLYESFAVQIVGDTNYWVILEPKDDLLGRRMKALISVLMIDGFAAAELAGKDNLFPEGRSMK
ncbi:hypothetical protein [Candidatus Palauibacter sp.]|uniref:hypothetical protein n=1 Tax=Candidatus Palauibacter sp. TaxID=3101350 RepID=UPI003B02BD5B